MAQSIRAAEDRLLTVVPTEAMDDGHGRDQTPASRPACRDIAATLLPVGPMNVQQIVADDGTSYTIEIHPRFSSTACLTVQVGVDELGLLIRDALGEPVSAPPEYDPGVYFLRYDDHVFVLLGQYRSTASES